MIKRKKLLSMVLTATMVLQAVPAAFATEGDAPAQQPAPMTAAGSGAETGETGQDGQTPEQKEITEPLICDNTGDKGTLYKDGYHWDQASKTLTLKNATINVGNDDAKPAIQFAVEAATLKLEGENTVINTGNLGANKGVITTDSQTKLTISGPGSLAVNAVGSDGIYASGDLTIENLAKLTVKTDGNGKSGIVATGNISINNSTVETTATAEESNGLVVDNAASNLTINNSTVVATGGSNGIIPPKNNVIGITDSFVDASSIAKNEGTIDNATWSGVVFNGSAGKVYGAPTLKSDATIPNGKTLTVENNQTLKVADGKTLTIAESGNLKNNGTVNGGNLVLNNNTLTLAEGSNVTVKKLTSSNLKLLGKGTLTVGAGGMTVEEGNLTVGQQNDSSQQPTITVSNTNDNGLTIAKGNMTVYNGTVQATGTNGIVAKSGVTVNGGSVTATGNNGIGMITNQNALDNDTSSASLVVKGVGKVEATGATGIQTKRLEIGEGEDQPSVTATGIQSTGMIAMVEGEDASNHITSGIVTCNGAFKTGTNLTVGDKAIVKATSYDFAQGNPVINNGDLAKLPAAGKATLKVVGGTWTADGSNADKKVDLYQCADKDGKFTPEIVKPLQKDIPTGMTPSEGYQATGSWSPDPTKAVAPDSTLTYTFQPIPTPPAGGGAIQPKPPVAPVAPEAPSTPNMDNVKPGETVTETKPDGTKVEASKDAAGNTTVTETKPDGTVIQSEEKTNGDKTVTETKKDGTSVTSEEKANGDKTVTETKKDGTSVTSEEKANGDKTVTETKKDGSSVTSEKKANGDKAITETKKDGTSTKFEEKANGDQIVTKTKPDGSSTSEGKTADGTTAKSTTDANGKTEVEATLSKKAVEEAEKTNIPVPLPVAPVEATKDSQTAPVVNITLKTKAENVKVSLPVSEPAAGTVAVIVHKDGSEEVVRKSGLDEAGLKLVVENGITIKVVDNTKDFADTDNHWAENAIDFATGRALYNGTSATTFSPDLSMSRGMLAQVLHNLESNPEAATQSNFTDVPEDLWCSDAIAWATEQGIVAGYPDGSYGTNDSISREQLAVMLYRYAGEPAHKDSVLSFDDADKISGYAQDAMAWAVENGIISGMDNNTLSPQGTATRAQVASMLMRFINL